MQDLDSFRVAQIEDPTPQQLMMCPLWAITIEDNEERLNHPETLRASVVFPSQCFQRYWRGREHNIHAKPYISTHTTNEYFLGVQQWKGSAWGLAARRGFSIDRRGFMQRGSGPGQEC